MQKYFRDGIKTVSVTDDEKDLLRQELSATGMSFRERYPSQNVRFHVSYKENSRGRSVSARVFRITLAKSPFF